ncbi:MAG: hypothetical protein M3Q89_12580, partial [Verrucomicrobiota bacterium]|nr:hypothetical protein [Verrucomicrobiota bacterium]
HYNPVAALCVFGAALLALLYFAPKILRAMKAKIWLVFKKLNGPADAGLPGTLPIALPSNLQDVFSQQNVLSETIAWAVPCLSGKGRRVPANLFGALVATNEEPRRVVFVARKGGRGIAKTIELENCLVAREPKFLSENLVIFPEAGKGPKYLFVFPRSSGAMVEEAVEYLRVRLAVPPPSAAALPLPESEQDAEPVLQG